MECEKGEVYSCIEVENTDVQAICSEVSQHAPLVEPQEQELEKSVVEIENIEHNVEKQHYNNAKSDNTNNSIKDTTHERIMVDLSIQFSFDTAQEILSEHSYSLKCTEEPSVNTCNNCFSSPLSP